MVLDIHAGRVNGIETARRTVELPGRHRVPLRSILFTAYYNHVVTVYLADGAGDASASQMRVRTTQAEIERLLLPHEEFVAPARGIVVNLFAVAKMSPEDFILRSGHIIRIARRRSKEMREAYDRFREELAQRGTTEW